MSQTSVSQTALTQTINSSETSESLQLTSVDSKLKWVLASNNQGKLSEFRRLFNSANLEVSLISQGELNIEDAVEDGLSFVENAIIKARHASKISQLPAIADDSGLCVPVLNHAPGIYSARYAGEHGNDKKNYERLIAELAVHRNSEYSGKHVAAAVKGYFVCVLAMVRHAEDPLPIISQGLWHGEISNKPIGDNGFGYDPIFWLPELNQSAAQLDAVTKNALSHRGRAMANLIPQLKTYLDV